MQERLCNRGNGLAPTDTVPLEGHVAEIDGDQNLQRGAGAGCIARARDGQR